MKLWVLLFVFPVFAFAEGVYRVPAPDELEEYASYPVTEFEVKRAYGRITVRYEIPRALTGAQNIVEFEGADGDRLELSGLNGTMSCDSSKIQDCAVTYYGLVIDEEARTQLLRELSRDESEFTNRLVVAQSFCRPRLALFATGGEPCGFLTLP